MSSSQFGRNSSHFSEGDWERQRKPINRKRSWHSSRGRTDFHRFRSDNHSPYDEKAELVTRASIHDADYNLEERYRNQFALSRSGQDRAPPAPPPPPRRRETPGWNESADRPILQPCRPKVHFAGQENVAGHRRSGFQSADPLPQAGILRGNEEIYNYNSSRKGVFPPVLIADPIQGASKLEKKITNAMSLELSECISELKLSGDYDRIRKESMQKIEANPLFSEIRKKVQRKTTEFLGKVKFSSSLDKTKIREELRNMLTGNPEFEHDMDQVVNQLKLYDVLQSVAAQEVRKYLSLPEEEGQINVEAMGQEEKLESNQEQVIIDDDESSLKSRAEEGSGSDVGKLSDDDDRPKWIVNAFKPVGVGVEPAEELDNLMEDDVPENKMENECVSEEKLPPACSASAGAASTIPVIDLVSNDEEEECLDDGDDGNESEYEFDSPSPPAFETFDQISPPRVDYVPEYEGPLFGME